MNQGDEPTDPGNERAGALAGEYVLGVLSAADRRAVEDRMDADPAFAALVDGWRRDLSTLDAHYAPEPVPDRLQAAIERRLFGLPPRPAGFSLWNSLGFWRGLSVAALVVSAALGAIVAGILPWPEAPDAAPLVARLSGEGSPIGLVAEYDPRSRALTVLPAAFAPEGRKSLELWLVPGEGAPVSIGIVPEDGARLAIDRSLGALIGDGALLAVSLEPPGGSPTGVATGPVLATGTLARR